MVEYSIYKEKDPVETVENIKKILKDINIPVQETITSSDINRNKLIPSLRIEIIGTHIGTNGKGTCIENARASGYAEFMERLQNGFLIDFKVPDIKFNENEGNEKLSKLEFIPFYSVKEQKIIDLPYRLIDDQQGSVGLAAGNTIEEALVQGISEICEKYAMRQVFLNNISLPDIPKEIYMKYDKINNIVNLFESYGYNVYIKDASIGKNLPVVCTVLIHEDKNIMTLSWGSHPTLAVAIERTLTEIFQGKELKAEILKNDVSFISRKDFKKKYKNNLGNIAELDLQSLVIFEMNDYIKKQFIINKSDFEFNQNTWIKESDDYTNKDLLKFLVKGVQKISNKNIYVRDVSFLGFAAVRIYIPKLSKFVNLKFSEKENLINWMNLELNTKEIWSNDIESLIRALELKNNHHWINECFKISELSNEYLLLLCSIVVKDYTKVIEYAKTLIDYNKTKRIRFSENKKFIIYQIKDYYELKVKNLPEEKINKILEEKYSKKDNIILNRFIKNLSLDVIKNIIVNNKPKRKFSNDFERKHEEIKNKLSELYQKNVPNQNNLKAIFDFID